VQNKLTFLHVYHHWVTMLLVWNCLENLIPIQWCAELLNCFVHIFMYDPAAPLFPLVAVLRPPPTPP